ncbi:MAG: hypothetical protein QM831_20830 [Kofleriaceae bacterium]
METLTSGDVAVDVVPERGAIVTGLRVGNRDVLYLDRTTLDDPTKNVRGGVPLLFPFAGKLKDETFVLTGTKMKQHGFARNKAWRVTDRSKATLTMRLDCDDETRAQFPYDFTATHRILVLPDGVQLELTVSAGGLKVPVSPGWHPYFNCTDKPAVREGFTDASEFDFGEVAPTDGISHWPALALEITADPVLRHLQFWSQPGKPFVCIEPFYGTAGTINTEARGWVPANSARTYWMRIRVTGR